ncbi:hypothetical protein L0V05_10150 [Tabrizicola sp. J26]|uniref:hypothetical protein n=1 Tax=Alitabrizicola rongguiensis TaxID=2909234 RepID=UPI001F19FD9E|nr:hypothetical protein [Tabrizicola rongguiensis]MCF1709178.1 hypothetical protein [Tabrizicola rongguiensis]
MLKNAMRATLAVAVTLTLASPALAVDRNVRIHNETGLTLYRFYSTNSGSPKWGKDVMGSSTLPPGGVMNMNFDNKYGYCEFDFRAIFEDGTELTRGNVNVCEIGDYYYQP